MCRDMTNPSAPVEVWRTEVGKTHRLARCETYVVYSGGLIVARYLDTVLGLDPATGAVRWTTPLKNGGSGQFANILPTDSAVYIGIHSLVYAISSSDGKLLWEYDFAISHFTSVATLVACGTRIFALACQDVVYLNASTGAVVWKAKFDKGDLIYPPNAAWDGGNRVILGLQGYIYRFDLRTGSQLERINLKNTGNNAVNVGFDFNRKVFYALTCAQLFAISPGEDNKIIWECDANEGKTLRPLYGAFAIEPSNGRIYISHSLKMCAVDPNGTLLFAKQFRSSQASSYHAMASDLSGTGLVLLGAGGYIMMFDADGNVVHKDDLPGMRYNQTDMCTVTASVDPNSSAHVTNSLKSTHV